MNGAIVNMLARRLGCPTMYPDWYVVRRQMRASFKSMIAVQLRRPVMRAMIQPGQVLRATLAGLPELDMFPGVRDRRAALDHFGAVICGDRNWRWWTVAGVMIAIAATAGYAMSALVACCGVPLVSYGLSNYILRAGAMLLVFWTLLRKTQRVGAAAHMRRLLIDRGVAMCLRCGYCLAGHDERAQRCPECGRAIDELTRGKLRAGGCGGLSESVTRESDTNATPQAAEVSRLGIAA